MRTNTSRSLGNTRPVYRPRSSPHNGFRGRKPQEVKRGTTLVSRPLEALLPKPKMMSSQGGIVVIQSCQNICKKLEERVCIASNGALCSKEGDQKLSQGWPRAFLVMTRDMSYFVAEEDGDLHQKDGSPVPDSFFDKAVEKLVT